MLLDHHVPHLLQEAEAAAELLLLYRDAPAPATATGQDAKGVVLLSSVVHTARTHTSKHTLVASCCHAAAIACGGWRAWDGALGQGTHMLHALERR